MFGLLKKKNSTTSVTNTEITYKILPPNIITRKLVVNVWDTPLPYYIPVTYVDRKSLNDCALYKQASVKRQGFRALYCANDSFVTIIIKLSL